MISLDYVVLGDYVRQDAGGIHIMGAGIDTITTLVLPAAVSFGLAARLVIDTAEVAGTHHKLTLTFMGPDGVLANLTGSFESPQRDDTLPVHWPAKLNLGLGANVVFPHYGEYSLEVSLDGQPLKSLDLRVIPPAQGQPGAPA
jgi:hypothetical protein